MGVDGACYRGTALRRRPRLGSLDLGGTLPIRGSRIATEWPRQSAAVADTGLRRGRHSFRGRAHDTAVRHSGPARALLDPPIQCDCARRGAGVALAEPEGSAEERAPGVMGSWGLHTDSLSRAEPGPAK